MLKAPSYKKTELYLCILAFMTKHDLRVEAPRALNMKSLEPLLMTGVKPLPASNVKGIF